MAGAVARLSRYSDVSEIKAEGVNYTPPELADFVAAEMINCAQLPTGRSVRLLDPAVGHGELLVSLLERLNCPVEVYGYETDAAALAVATSRLHALFPTAKLHFRHGSFLEHVAQDFAGGLFGRGETYDLIIANPPYVRTQVMGSDRAKELSSLFGLSGRVDLYHAFLVGIARVLATTGTAGLIVSNRFMTTKGGAATRAALVSDLRLKSIFDLGDTKLFDAAVLPAVIIAHGNGEASTEPSFASIYETKEVASQQAANALQALTLDGNVSLPDGRTFAVKHGVLDAGRDCTDVWRLASGHVDDWLSTVAAHTWRTFGQIGNIRVGVKTCADKVFIPKKWETELELHRALTTHHTARRFRPLPPTRKILYPHEAVGSKKRPVDLQNYPKSRAYLESHRGALEARSYVMEAGRKWYEIWVPQNPAEWALPKLVFRDISEQPTFWMDLDGTVVNGDCYWMVADERLLWLALAVGNSTFIEHFYDKRFNNKLYAGRRRFITQYVEQFPLPAANTQISGRIIEASRTLYATMTDGPQPEQENALDRMIWEAFGLALEEV